MELTEQIQLAVRTGLERGAPDYKSSALTARLFLAFAKKKTTTKKKTKKQKHAQKTEKTKHNTKNKSRKKENKLTNFFTQFKGKLKLISGETTGRW